MGGRHALKGIGETPDVFEAVFEYPGFLATWSNREVAASGGGGLEFHGTKGMLKLNRAGFEVVPDRLISPEDQIPRFTAPRPPTDDAALRTTALKEEGYEQVRDQFVPHVRNFLDCVKSRAAAGLRPAEQPSDRHPVPPRQHRHEGRPRPALGRGQAATWWAMPRPRGS